jgi:hypothetical protein
MAGFTRAGLNKFERILASSWQQNFAAAFTENSCVVSITERKYLCAYLFVA